MNATEPACTVVYRTDSDWWDTMSRTLEEIEDDNGGGWYCEPAIWDAVTTAAGFEPGDTDVMISEVVSVAERHTALRPGDLIVFNGLDVVFVRKPR